MIEPTYQSSDQSQTSSFYLARIKRIKTLLAQTRWYLAFLFFLLKILFVADCDYKNPNTDSQSTYNEGKPEQKQTAGLRTRIRI